MIYPSALHTRPGKSCILPRIPRYVVVENRVVFMFHFVTGGLPPLQICPPLGVGVMCVTMGLLPMR
jgi:hypothetical protein